MNRSRILIRLPLHPGGATCETHTGTAPPVAGDIVAAIEERVPPDRVDSEIYRR